MGAQRLSWAEHDGKAHALSLDPVDANRSDDEATIGGTRCQERLGRDPEALPGDCKYRPRGA